MRETGGGWDLLDAVRGFAAGAGAPDAIAGACARHGVYYATLAEHRVLHALRMAGRAGVGGKVITSLPELEVALRRAMDAGNWGLAARLAAALGEGLLQTGPFGAAARRLDEVLEHLPAGPEAALALLVRGRAARFRGRLAESQAFLERAVAAVRDPDPDGVWLAARLEQGFAHTKTGQLAAAQTRFDEVAKACADGRAPGSLALCCIGQADVLLQQGSLDTLPDLLGRALTLARLGAAPVVEAMAHSNLGRLHVHGHTTEAREHLRRAAELFDQLGLSRSRAIALDVLGNLCLSLGPVEEGAEALREARRRLERLGARGLATVVEANLGTALALLGDLDGGIELKERSAVDYARRAQRWNQAINCGNVAVLYLRRDGPGDRETARARLAQCESILVDLGAEVVAGSYRAVDAEARSMHGEHDSACQDVREALELVRGAAPRQEVLKVLAMAARVHLRAGHRDLGSRWLTEAVGLRAELGCPPVSVAGIEVERALALAQGD